MMVINPPPLQSVKMWRARNVINFCRFHHDRHEYIKEHGWYILTEETADSLARFLKGRKVVEVGTGTGYLAAHMKRLGVTHYRAYDHFRGSHYNYRSVHYGTKKRNAFRLNLSLYDAVVMCWPEYDTDFAARIVSRMKPGQILIYQGESCGGCTGDDRFFDLLVSDFTPSPIHTLRLNHHHHQWYGINDEWHVYIKQ